MSRIVHRITRGGESGFTLVELSVAMFVTLLVMASLAGAFVASLKGVAVSKQRQTATGLATAVMEQFRAVDYGTLSAGLYCADLAGDTRLSVSGTCGGTGTVTFNGGPGISESLKVQSGTPSTQVPPLYPHRRTQTLDNVAYTTAAYVTNAATSQTAFNLTVLVSWSSTVSHGAKSVIQRSLEYSPSRCLSSATHPYSGACQASFHGDAGTTNAGITVSNPDDATADIYGLAGKKLEVSLPGISSTMGVEQVTKLSASGDTMSVVRTDSAGTEARSGGDPRDIAADTDPSSPSSGSAAATITQPAASILKLEGAAGSLGVAPVSGGSGSLDGRAASTATSCLDKTGTALAATGRPCAWGVISPNASASASNLRLDLPSGAPAISLATMAPAPTAMRAAVAQVVTAGGTACPTTTAKGCVTAQAARSLGTLTLGGLPTVHAGDTSPSGWTGSLVTVSGVRESAYAEAGIGARSPSFTRTAGTITYYNAATSSYVSKDLTTLTSDLAVDLGTVSGSFIAGGHTTAVVLSASFRAGANAAVAPTVTAPDAACKTDACSAAATAPSTLTATLIYDIAIDGMRATRFSVVVDLGSVLARSSYKAAFDA